MIDLIFPAIWIGCALGMVYANRGLVRIVRRSLRREAVLLENLQMISEEMQQTPPSCQGVADALIAGVVRYADEVNNQALNSKPWSRIPEVGEEWPNFVATEIRFSEEPE